MITTSSTRQRIFAAALWVILTGTACTRAPETPIVITATFDPYSYTPAAADTPLTNATSTPIAEALPAEGSTTAQTYIVQPGDTLSGIAVQFDISVERLQALNQIENPDLLAVGQVLRLPDPPIALGDAALLIPNSRLVRAPGSADFDVAAFINQQAGYIRTATDDVGTEVLTSSQVVRRVSLEYSVDPRLLLTLLELKGGWLTNPNPSDVVKTYPLGAPASAAGFDRNGLYRQLSWATDRLNAGYYGWLEGGLSVLEFEDGTRVSLGSTLNAGTVAVEYLLSLYTDVDTWNQQVNGGRFAGVYRSLFGDPFAGAIDPVVPAGLQQPTLTLPFAEGETWFFTGGPHGGWGDGSAWAAVDFAPPDERSDDSPACYVSEFYAVAVADGVIARVDEGTVILDLDGDGDESTGWTILYLHIAAQDRVELGAQVHTGDRIGHPSCEGGVSNGTHLHIARRYNGEWIPAWCSGCDRPAFTVSGWSVVGLVNQLYQGFLVRGSEQRTADQGRLNPDNRISWS